PGGGFSPDRQRWITCRPGFFLSVRVLSRLFRRLFLERLTAAYQAGRLLFFTDQAALAEPAAFQARLAALRKRKWVVYAKRPFCQCQPGRQYRIGPPVPRRTRPNPVERRRERRHRKLSRRRRVERLSLLRRAYDHHRDL